MTKARMFLTSDFAGFSINIKHPNPSVPQHFYPVVSMPVTFFRPDVQHPSAEALAGDFCRVLATNLVFTFAATS